MLVSTSDFYNLAGFGDTLRQRRICKLYPTRVFRKVSKALNLSGRTYAFFLSCDGVYEVWILR